MRERSRTEYTILNVATGTFGYAINTILGFLCRMVFVKCLSADYLGINGLFTNILTMLSLAELGVGNAIVYALYQPLAKREEKKIASLMQFYRRAYQTIGIFVGVIGISLLPVLKFIIQEVPDTNENIYILYLIHLVNTVLTYFFSYRGSLLTADQRGYLVMGIHYIITVAQSILQIVVLFLTKNYVAYLAIQTLGTFLYGCMISYVAAKEYPYIIKNKKEKLLKEERKKLFSNVRDLTIYKVSGLMVNSTDNILITFFQGIALTGIASNYTLLVTTLNSLLSQIFNGLTASIGNYNAIEEKERKVELFYFLNLMNFWIFGWASVGIIVCASDLVRWCFGEAYVLPNKIPFIMAANFYTVGLMNAVWTYKHTMGIFYYGRFIQIATGIINIIASILLGQRYGLFGIFAATLLARACTNLWYDPYVIFRHGFGISPLSYVKKYVIYGVIFLLTSIASYVGTSWIDATTIYGMIGKIVLCSLFTNVIFFFSFFQTAEFQKLRSVVRNVCHIIS